MITSTFTIVTAFKAGMKDGNCNELPGYFKINNINFILFFFEFLFIGLSILLTSIHFLSTKYLIKII